VGRFKQDKHGQFFLIAAVVIIVVAVSIVTISNYSQPRDVVRLYDLGEELGIESQQILDYGTYNQLNDAELRDLMETFIQNYVNYIGESGNLIFIFGNQEKIYALSYQQLASPDICVTLYSETTGGICLPLYTDTNHESQEFPAGELGSIDRVIISLGGTQYEFSLKPGENFYFVIWQKIGEETHVVTSEDKRQARS
jgi:hypothetical protein